MSTDGLGGGVGTSLAVAISVAGGLAFLGVCLLLTLRKRRWRKE